VCSSDLYGAGSGRGVGCYRSGSGGEGYYRVGSGGGVDSFRGCIGIGGGHYRRDSGGGVGSYRRGCGGGGGHYRIGSGSGGGITGVGAVVLQFITEVVAVVE
jgi:hypothetical protein